MLSGFVRRWSKPGTRTACAPLFVGSATMSRSEDFRKRSTWPYKACLLQSSGNKGIAVLGRWTILVAGSVNVAAEPLHLIPLRTEIITTGNHRMRLVKYLVAPHLCCLHALSIVETANLYYSRHRTNVPREQMRPAFRHCD